MSLVWEKCGSLHASTSAFYTLEHPQIRTSAFYPRLFICVCLSVLTNSKPTATITAELC